MSIQNVLHEVDLIRPLKIRSNSSDVHMPFSLGPRMASRVEPQSDLKSYGAMAWRSVPAAHLKIVCLNLALHH